MTSCHTSLMKFARVVTPTNVTNNSKRVALHHLFPQARINMAVPLTAQPHTINLTRDFQDFEDDIGLPALTLPPSQNLRALYYQQYRPPHASITSVGNITVLAGSPMHDPGEDSSVQWLPHTPASSAYMCQLMASNCPVPHLWTKTKAKQKTHRTKYHGNVTVMWEGQKWVVSRPPQGQLICPCGLHSHTHVDSHLFESLMKKIVHPGPTDEVELPEHNSPLSTDVAMESADDGYYALSEPESDKGTDGGTTEDEDNDNEPSHFPHSSDETLPNAQHSWSNNTSPAIDIPTTSICTALHAHVHAPLKATSTHGNTYSLTCLFKGDTLLNVNHCKPESKPKIDQTDDEPFKPDSDPNADQSDEDQSDTDNDGELMTPMDLNPPSDLADPAGHILQCSVHVNPIFHLTICLDCAIAIPWHKMWGHQAHTPNPIPNAPASAIDGMKIIPDLFKCNVPACTSHTLFKTKKHFHSHYALREVQAFVTERSLHAKETTYHCPLNQRPRGPLLAQTNWEHCIENVDLKMLRQTVSNPDGEPDFLYLIEVTQQYYQNIAANLSCLSTLTLRALLSTSPSVHKVIFSLLTHVSPEFLKNEMKDLFTLFLITYHLSNDFGNTSRICQVPPTISEAQWCFRAMAGVEIYMKMGQYNDNSFETYVALVCPYLIDGNQMLFTCLHQKRAFLSTLSYIEPGLLSCPWEDILDYIDQRTDPTDSDMWFLDRPQQSDQNTSIFSFQENRFDIDKDCLLNHLAKHPLFFSKIQGFRKPHQAGNIWEWIAILNELVSSMFYCVGQRQLFILNGLLTISTTYEKTASTQGHSNLIARCPCHTALKLMLVILGVIYPAAAALATYVMPVTKVQAYLLYIFVQDGSPMDTHQFSQSLTNITLRYLRVSKHWHTTIGQCENCTKLETQQSAGDNHVQLYDRLLGPLKTTIYNTAHQAIMSMGVEIIDELRNITTGMGNGILRGLQDMFGHYISVNPAASIVITPLVALTEDMARQLATTRIEGGQDPHIQNVLTAQIVIVSAHQAGTDDFFHWAQSIKKGSSTISPISLPRLCSQMQIPPSLIRIIQAPLHRGNISYSVISVLAAQLKEKVIETHRSIVLQEKDRGIIYCTTIALIKELSELLYIPYYTSRLDDQLDDSANTEEKNRRFNAWRDGDTPSQRWMIATLCFGEGIDFLGVCYIIHIESKGVIRQTLWLPQDTPSHTPRANRTSHHASPTPHLHEPTLSIKSVAADINTKYATGLTELRVLKHVLDTIKTIGCVYCWVSGEHRVGPHSHPEITPSLHSKVISLLAPATREDTTYWVYCYKCWVPFQEPCMHPPLQSGSLSNHLSCPYGAQFPFILPTVVALIRKSKVIADGRPTNPYLQKIASRLAVDPTHFASIRSLQVWIKHDPKHADEIPRCHSLVIAFYREFRTIPPDQSDNVHMEDVQPDITDNVKMANT
ncbi:hypothetical protein BDR03DRAFT_986972 [Suillus americanus]|nr:hypothetical protein BDR03DRAFT_986972 [Suillus americanus]